MKKLRLKSAPAPILRATLPFVKRAGPAIRNMNVAYYRAYSKNMKASSYLFLEKEKRRRATLRWAGPYVSNILENLTSKGFSGKSGAGITLNGIYKKNCAIIRRKIVFKKTTNLLKVVSRPEMLWLAHKRLKGNRGRLPPL